MISALAFLLYLAEATNTPAAGDAEMLFRELRDQKKRRRRS